MDTNDTATDLVTEYCDKCAGHGHILAFSHIDQGVCYACDGRGILRVETVADRDKREARNERARARRAARREAADNAAFIAWATAHDSDVLTVRAYVGDNPFMAEMIGRLDARLTLTDAQLAAAVKVATAPAKVVTPVADLPTGRATVTGTVKSVRVIEGHYGPTAKMLVQADGFTTWGTIPAAYDRIEAGDTVTFIATFTPKEDGFAVFSRPRAAAATNA